MLGGRLIETLQIPPIQYAPTRAPVLNPDGTTTFARALEVNRDYASFMWAAMTGVMNEQLNSRNMQVVVIPTNHDVTQPLLSSLNAHSIGRNNPATVFTERWGDGEQHTVIHGLIKGVEHVYLVGSPTNAEGLLEMGVAANTLKRANGVSCVTAITPFLLNGRADKNVTKAGDPFPGEAVTIQSLMYMLSGMGVDRMIVLEPHSSATHAFAAEAGIPLVPLSLWRVLLNRVMEKGILLSTDSKSMTPTPENCVLVRPDQGRNRAMQEIQRCSNIPPVSFGKTRLTADTVDVNGLTQEEVALINGRIGFGFDDEIATAGTLEAVLNKLQMYGLLAFAFLAVHLKATPGDPLKGTKGFLERVGHPLLTQIVTTDSRSPVNGENPKSLSAKLDVVSLVDFMRQVMLDDQAGINFWEDPAYRDLILQGGD